MSKGQCKVEVNNVPEYAKNHKYIVAKFDENSNALWFYGAWDYEYKWKAEIVAKEEGGLVLTNPNCI